MVSVCLHVSTCINNRPPNPTSPPPDIQRHCRSASLENAGLMRSTDSDTGWS